LGTAAEGAGAGADDVEAANVVVAEAADAVDVADAADVAVCSHYC
jgi:hypothetical protein